MKEDGIVYDRDFLRKHTGSMSQMAGIRRYVMAGGRGQGVEACEVNTGSGLAFTVLPGRGMDIAWASYKGIPFSYMAKAPVSAPAYYEREGMGWLRNFFAGLVTTCGLSNVGGPVEYGHPILGTIRQGLHGGITNTAADNVGVLEEWAGGKYTLSVTGRLREAGLHAMNLTLTRKVTAVMGEDRLILEDTVENEACAPEAVMLLYHINIGYPFLDEGARFAANSLEVLPNDGFSAEMIEEHNVMGPPVNGIFENVYFHDLEEAEAGTVRAALINEKLEAGVYIRYRKKELPYLTQWKMMGEGEYVLGMEPGNCTPRGRLFHENDGTLEFLAPGEQKKVRLEIGVLKDARAIQGYLSGL
jgi:hypothetical protein